LTSSAGKVKQISGIVCSVHVGSDGELAKEPCQEIDVQIDGIVGDRHRGFERVTWSGDKQPEGTTRRNERQWSAVSLEELGEISEAMDLSEPLSASCLGANFCLSGIPELSRLPKGTLLRFPSGAELCVEEYNPPCRDMGESLVEKYTTHSGETLMFSSFSKAAQFLRGVVGVVEVPGSIHIGDEVTVVLIDPPTWLTRSNETQSK